MNWENNYKIIENCRVYELTVAQLYKTYSIIFPEETGKWMSFAEEEIMHAQRLSVLKKYAEDEIISFKLTSMSIQSTDKARNFIQNHINLAQKGTVTLHNALIIALQIEDSIIEKSLFKMFDYSNKKAENIKRFIIKETMEHRERFMHWFASLEATSINVKAA